MPQKNQAIILTNNSTETNLAISYQAFKLLDWTIKYAGDNVLVGYTNKKWYKNVQQITVSIEGNLLNITSKMIKGESFDLMGKNQKNINAFIGSFENAEKSVTNDIITENKNDIAELRKSTLEQAEEEKKEAIELREAMNIGGSNLYATYAIMGINALVFILMVMNGAGLVDPNGLVHIKWGSNFAPLTLTGDWWRLVTNLFIHFGIIHLLANMYALYFIAIYLEPMLGKSRYVAAYLCTGVFGSLVSLWWHSTPVNSAGASGAIFGLYGLFFAFLTTDIIPAKVRQTLLKSIGIFILYNLVYGFKSGVDMSAHVGGIISGFLIGYLYIYNIRQEKQGKKLAWAIPVLVLVTAGCTVTYLQKNKMNSDMRNEVMTELKESDYKDVAKFNKDYNDFIELQNVALAPLKDSTATYNDALLGKLNTESKPAWQHAATIVETMKTYDLPARLKNKIPIIDQYVSARQDEINIVEQIIRSNKPEDFTRLDSERQSINQIVEKLEGK